VKKNTKIAIILVAILVVIDQVVKLWIKTSMQIGDEITVFSWFKIHFLENPGMAFGLSFGPKIGKIVLSVLRLGLIGVIIYLIRDVLKKNQPFGFLLPLVLILAGAIGNTIDCVFYGVFFDYAPIMLGRVVDMFYFPLFTLPQWLPYFGGETFFQPVFNIADSCITIGVIVFIAYHLFRKKTKQVDNN
jgi:signal peptidase II